MATLVGSHLVRCPSCGAERVLKVWSCGCARYDWPNPVGEHKPGCSNSRRLLKHALEGNKLSAEEVDESLMGFVDSGWDTYFRHYTSSCGSPYDLRDH